MADAVTLSGGEQQMLAVARVLSREVKLLLDEPLEGLAPVIVQEIERILHEVKKLGFTTIIVEQNAIADLNLADRAIILDMGEVVMHAHRSTNPRQPVASNPARSKTSSEQSE